MEIYRLIKVKDYEELTIKMLASIIAQYNKTKKELGKLRDISYSKIYKKIKSTSNNSQENKPGENLSQSKFKLEYRLERKISELYSQFENVKHNSRNSIQNFLEGKNLDSWFDVYGEDKNKVTARLQKEYDQFSESIKKEKIKK